MIIDKMKKRKPATVRRLENKVDIPLGKWIKCDRCKEILYKEDVKENYSICPNCGAYFRLSSRRRIAEIIDDGTYNEFDLNSNKIESNYGKFW